LKLEPDLDLGHCSPDSVTILNAAFECFMPRASTYMQTCLTAAFRLVKQYFLFNVERTQCQFKGYAVHLMAMRKTAFTLSGVF